MMKVPPRPPKIASWILQRIIEKGICYGAMGDLEEWFNHIVKKRGFLMAILYYWIQVFVILPGFFKNSILWSMIMFRNYFKIAFRNIVKQKGYSFINITGLAIGISCCILISLYISQELSYDTFHENSDRIYRIALETSTPQGKTNYAITYTPLALTLKADYPEIEKISRIYFTDRGLIKYSNKQFYENNFVFVDRVFFDIFTFPAIKGDRSNLLADPNSVVITSSIAKKYFGNQDPIGKILNYNNKLSLKVSGVIKDIPVKSHFHFDFAAPFSALNEEIFGRKFDDWDGLTNLYTYALIKRNLEIKSFEKKIKSFVTRYQGKLPNSSTRPVLQPLRKIHLYSHYRIEIEYNNSVSNLLIIATIGLFILVIACLNFINLSTARSQQRIKEIGIRKALGARRLQLGKQFMAESIIFAALSLVLSLLLVELLLPTFSSLVGTKIGFSFDNVLILLLVVIGIPLLAGTLSGIYPAVFLSFIKPVFSLKGGTYSGKKDSRFLRKVLVTIQFSISILLIAGTLISRNQLYFLRNFNLGFKKENIIRIPIHDKTIRGKYEIVKDELLKDSNILSATVCYKSPVGSNRISVSAYPEGVEKGAGFDVAINSTDFDFVSHFGLHIINGRNFSKNFSSDKKAKFIVNEELVKKMGYKSPGQIIGRKLLIDSVMKDGEEYLEGTIIGVTRNFHISSLHHNIRPYIMLHWPKLFNEISLTVNSRNFPKALAHIKKIWKKFSPNYPFQFRFLDNYINRLYTQEQETYILIRTFSIFAIFISCLGLFGLAAFSAQQRMKEIGIRKVVGATIPEIIILLAKEFTRWILLANLIALPIAFLVMTRWLQTFAYRTEISLFIFIFTAILSFVIALLTVIYQSVKAATANPVDVLKYE